MTEPKRLRRDQRSLLPPPMRLMPRDREILRALSAYRILSQTQLQTLFFGSKSTTQYRLCHLYQHGFLARHFLPVQVGRSPTLYTLDTRGVEVLRSEYGADYAIQLWHDQTGHEFLAHTLAINDVRIAVTLACERFGYMLSKWQGEADLKLGYDRVEIALPAGKKQSVSLIPDSYFVITTPRGVGHFFLEVDRGTMTTKRFQTKMLAYQAYVETGAYQRHYQTRSLRVLTVTLSLARCTHLWECAQQVKGSRLFWFGVLADVQPQTVLSSPLWRVAGSPDCLPLIPDNHPQKSP